MQPLSADCPPPPPQAPIWEHAGKVIALPRKSWTSQIRCIYHLTVSHPPLQQNMPQGLPPRQLCSVLAVARNVIVLSSVQSCRAGSKAFFAHMNAATDTALPHGPELQCLQTRHIWNLKGKSKADTLHRPLLSRRRGVPTQPFSYLPKPLAATSGSRSSPWFTCHILIMFVKCTRTRTNAFSPRDG